MERYTVRRGDTLSAIARRFNLRLTTLVTANPQIRNPARIFVGQFVNLPITARHAPGTPSGPRLSDIFGPGAVPVEGEPAKDPRFVQNAIIAVGIPIWGGAFALYRKVVNGRGIDAIMLQRSEASFANDPLKDSFAEIKVAYATRGDADRAIAASKFPNAFVYYTGAGGLLFPTIISDTTAPALCDALRKAVEQERKDAKAASRLGVDLLLWYVGARFPPKVGAPTPESVAETGAGANKGAAATDAALAGFTATEKAVISETRQILASPEMMQIRHAQALGEEITVKIGGRVIQYEPNWPFSGITDFEKNGFTMGREAFSSEAELTKTILHELHRLATSVVRGSGGAGLNQPETKAAFEFAERAFSAAFAPK